MEISIVIRVDFGIFLETLLFLKIYLGLDGYNSFHICMGCCQTRTLEDFFNET